MLLGVTPWGDPWAGHAATSMQQGTHVPHPISHLAPKSTQMPPFPPLTRQRESEAQVINRHAIHQQLAAPTARGVHTQCRVQPLQAGAKPGVKGRDIIQVDLQPKRGAGLGP